MKKDKSKDKDQPTIEKIPPLTALAIAIAIGVSMSSLSVVAMSTGGMLCGDTVERGQMIQQMSSGESSRTIWQAEKTHNGSTDD